LVTQATPRRRRLIAALLLCAATGCASSDFTGTSASGAGKSSDSDDDDDDDDDDVDGGESGTETGDGGDPGLGTGDAGTINGGTGVDSGDTGTDLGVDTDVGIFTEETALILRQRCGTAAEKETAFTLDFPSTAAENDCAWGADGNLPFQSGTGKVRAFRAQSAQFAVPENSVICGFELKSQSPSVRYDDYLFLDLEDYVLGTSSHTAADLEAAGMVKTNGLVRFEPVKAIGTLATTVAHNSRSSSLCPADGTCTIPSSDVAQPMSLTVPFAWFERLPAAVRTQSQFSVTVRVSGQGDSERQDCEHTGMTFDGKVRFVTR
jgi:hypothetical protein